MEVAQAEQVLNYETKNSLEGDWKQVIVAAVVLKTY